MSLGMTIIIAILMIVISPSVKPLDKTPLTTATKSSDHGANVVSTLNLSLPATKGNNYFDGFN